MLLEWSCLWPLHLDLKTDKIGCMSKYFGAITSLILWAAGTGLVLITLSGAALEKALMISLVALVVNIIAIVFGVGVED